MMILSRPLIASCAMALLLVLFVLLPLLTAPTTAASFLRARSNNNNKNNHHRTPPSVAHHKQQQQHQTRNLQATVAGRGIPGTTQTIDGYDTEMGKSAICWYSTGTSSAAAGGSAGPPSSSQSAVEAADTFAEDTSTTTDDEENNTIALPNPLVDDYLINGRVHLLSACPVGNSLQANAPKVHAQQGERLRTLSWYNYTITATLNVTSLLQEQQQIQATKGKAIEASGETLAATTNDESRQKEASEAQAAALDEATARGFVTDAAVQDDEDQNNGNGESSSSSPTSYVAFQVVNCVAGVSGFCSPFIHEEANHRLYVDAMARGEDAPASPDRGDLHGETHVHSPYIKVALPPSEGPVYEINVTIPMLINHPNNFFSIAAVQLFLTYPSSDSDSDGNNVTNNNTTKLVRYDMANALLGQERLLTYQEPAVILTVPLGIQVVSYIAIGCTALVIAFLLQQVIHHRQHQILQLSQGSFLMVFLVAALVASIACILLEPKNDAYCNLGRPIIMCFLQLMYAITVGRLWRIHTVISPLLLQTLQKRSQMRMQSSRKNMAAASSWPFLPPWLSKYSWICSFCSCCCCSSDGSGTAASTTSMNQMAISLMHFLERVSTAVSSCCRRCGVSKSKNSGSQDAGQHHQRGSRGGKNLRRQVTPAQLAMVVSIFTFPQVLMQILAGTLQPLQYEIDFNEDESTGRAVCATDDSVTLASSLHMYGFYLFLLLIIVLLFMAQATRELPSLFNETRYIFDSTLFTLVLMAVGISVILVTNHPTTSPGVQYLVTVSLVLCMTLNSTLRIVWPKLSMIWRGETVLVSKLVSDHAAKRRSEGKGGTHSSTLDSLRTSPSPQNNDGSVYVGNNVRISGLHPPPPTFSTTSSAGSNSGQLTHRGAAGVAANASGHLRYHSSFGHSNTILEEMDQFHNESIVSATSAEVTDETEDPAASTSLGDKGKQQQGATTTSDLSILGGAHPNVAEKKKEAEDDVLVFEKEDEAAERKSLIDYDEVPDVLDTEPDHGEKAIDTPTTSGPADATQKDTSPASDSIAGHHGDVENTVSPPLPSPPPPPPPPQLNHHGNGKPNTNRTAPVMVRQNETPARRLVLKMVDLEDCLSAVNERIMAGMAVPTEEWETLRRVTGKMGDIFTNDVQFEWEEKNGNGNGTRLNVKSHGGSRRHVPTPSPKTSPPKAQPMSAVAELNGNEFEI